MKRMIKSMWRTTTSNLALLLTFVLLASCTHKELCELHVHAARVRIDADWSEFRKETPTGMTVKVYPAQGGSPVTHLTNTISHAYVNLPVGHYRALVFNQSETEFGSLAFRGMDRWETAEVLTGETRSEWYKTRAEGEKLGTAPEWFATDRTVEDFEITEAMVEYTGNNLAAPKPRNVGDQLVATLTPRNVIYTVTVTVHIKGFHNLRSARASLSGLAEGYRFAQQRPTENQVTQLMESWEKHVDASDPTRGYIRSTITCFGLPHGHRGTAEENAFDLSILLVDNKTVLDFPFLVGDKFERDMEAEVTLGLNLNVELEIDDPLPDVQPEGGSGSAFDAKVDDWGEEENFEIGV